MPGLAASGRVMLIRTRDSICILYPFFLSSACSRPGTHAAAAAWTNLDSGYFTLVR
jgi:hypothetical protein